jgi:hypothetical protein
MARALKSATMVTIPAQISAEDATEVVRARMPGVGAIRARLLHHPFSASVYRVQHSAIGRRMVLNVHTMVDLCSGAASVCAPWPEPLSRFPAEDVHGPDPILTAADVEDQARQCVVRTLMHRRFSLCQPQVDLTARIDVLGKPNWLVTLEGEDFAILVDGLSGIHHTVSMPAGPRTE